MKAKATGNAGMTRSQAAAMMKGLKPKLLEGLSSTEIDSILAAATWKRLAANSLITREGDAAERLFLILDGFARFYTMSPQGKKVIIMWIRPGELIGGAVFLSKPQEYVLSAEAARKSSALVWDRTVIRSLAMKSPRLIENVLMLTLDYIVQYRILYVTTSCQSASQRVAQVLGYLTRDIGQKVRGGVELYIRNEELAHEANVTIFTVSRLMGEWERKGFLKKGRGKVLLRWPEKLIQLEP
jgi:CRP-like cAMP-binding protein